MTQMIFVNLPVKDLEASKGFYEALGYRINPQFSNEQGACVVISDTIYAMLMTEPLFSSFLPKDRKIGDSRAVCGSWASLSCADKAEVDRLVGAAEKAGGRIIEPVKSEYEGMMYSGAFEDLDGHIWNILWMDPAMAQGQAA